MSWGVTNPFFNNYFKDQEQQLYQTLITEAIAIAGLDVYYCPRTLTHYDSLLEADDQSAYNQAFMVAMYIENVDSFTGDGNFMSKFGLEIRDQIIMSVSAETFASEIAAYTSQLRPNEGDLVYFPLNQKCFQIKFTDKFEMFLPFGMSTAYKLTCELFEYSDEKFNTGIPEIDIIQTKFDTDELDYGIVDNNGNFLMDSYGNYILTQGGYIENAVTNADNDEITKEAAQFIDFSVRDPFSENEGLY